MKNSKTSSLEDYDVLRANLGENASDHSTATALSSYLSEEKGLPPIHAVLGGILANDIIKIVSRKGDLSTDKIFMYSILDDGGWTGF